MANIIKGLLPSGKAPSVLKEEIIELVGEHAPEPDLSGYASKEEVSTRGVQFLSGKMELTNDLPRLIEVYSTGVLSIASESFPADTALALRRNSAGIWEVAVVGETGGWRSIGVSTPGGSEPSTPEDAKAPEQISGLIFNFLPSDAELYEGTAKIKSLIDAQGSIELKADNQEAAPTLDVLASKAVIVNDYSSSQRLRAIGIGSPLGENAFTVAWLGTIADTSGSGGTAPRLWSSITTSVESNGTKKIASFSGASRSGTGQAYAIGEPVLCVTKYDGEKLSTQISATDGSPISASGATLRTNLSLGAGYSGAYSNGANIKTGRFFAYNRALDAEEISSLYAWAKNEWGVKNA
ncbi:hypothetical protein [Rothia sp. P4278]|uniref:hypothetical protein n=1 Tax=Rothia sp. P4278 TaxID=3402658 RepID=UPI003AE8D491